MDSPVIMDPQLLMAARSGACKALENLLVNHEEAAAESHLVIRMPEEGASNTSSTSSDLAQQGQPANRPAAASPLLEGLTLDLDQDSALHVVATSGDGEQYVQCAEMIHGRARHLLGATNNRGDTPLHCAARAGHHAMVCRLISLAAHEGGAANGRILSTRNKLGETALHGAIRGGNRMVVERLVSEDPELARIPEDRGIGASPLYLAVSLGRLEIARDLLDRSPTTLSYSGPEGQNVLHISVYRGEALSILLDKCKDVKVDIDQGGRHRSMPVLLHLTSQGDKNGSTPLHFAASLKTSTTGLSRWSEYFHPKPSPATLLLDANESAMYQPDNGGSYPIHVAASNGTLKAVITLLGRSPGCIALRNMQGKTFLHVAVEKKRHSIVAFVCKRPELASVLNVQDNQGDTALHLAVKAGLVSIFNLLFRNRENSRGMIHQSLALARAPVGHSRQDHFYEKHSKRRDEEIDSEYLTNATSVLGISSVLIATVTFAAAFTLPGGYRADDHANGGTPTLAGSYSFNAFITANTLAFSCSLLATVSLLYSGMPSREISIRYVYQSLSLVMMRSSATSLVAAFALGLYVVLAPVALTMAKSVCAITFLSLSTACMEVRRPLIVANSVRIRVGICAARYQAAPVLKFIGKRFWSYVIIFGLPAVLKIRGTQ
uniref:PGG domain-containing protein n=1 Tax=Oryza meridionalis TaxID=40149 RepID=A0A0E0ELE8_9ORYZ